MLPSTLAQKSRLVAATIFFILTTEIDDNILFYISSVQTHFWCNGTDVLLSKGIYWA